jgi:periplasmic divalent cation tolerance protein
MKQGEFSSVLVAFPDRTGAHDIIKHLLEAHLIACANLFPVESSYWWKGRMEQTSEWMVLMKIRSEDFGKVREEILERHRYQVPCIVRYAIIEADERYLDWIRSSTERPLED